MRDHAVTAAESVLHVAPRVILRSGLNVPDITSIATKLAILESGSDVISIADGTTRSVY